jgi:undecaprenyl-diphosphatase
MGEANIDWLQFVLAMAFSAVAGWVCIAAFLALLKRVGLMPFVIYRLALGLVLLWLVW